MLLLLLVGGGVGPYANNIGSIGAGGILRPGTVPAQYVLLIRNAAQTCPEVTAPLIAAQLKAESGFQPSAVSPVGARGIAQFMPGTWAAVGRDENGDGKADPHDPVDAIPAQARYNCDQLAEIRRTGIVGDEIDLMLAAYNAGLGAVRRWKGIPPYAETQTYVRRIRAYMAEFTDPAGGMGVPATSGPWVVPLIRRLTSGFGPRWGAFHSGVDVAAPIGTPIVAAAAGTVVAAGPASGYGLWVKIDHGGGVVTVYGHVDQYSVSIDQVVQPGLPIATVGNRGNSTGPHLHFQIEVNGAPVDPVNFYATKGIRFT
jgi:murein DD-endopeptidase MepM/ murein hydrolase activator NlpD